MKKKIVFYKNINNIRESSLPSIVQNHQNTCYSLRERLLCFSKYVGLSQLPSKAPTKSSLGSGHLNPFDCFDNAFFNKQSQFLERKKIWHHPRSCGDIPSSTEVGEILVGAITMSRRGILLISYKLVCILTLFCSSDWIQLFKMYTRRNADLQALVKTKACTKSKIIIGK